MPPKSKRKRQLEDSLVKAREEKRKHESGEDDHSNVVENKADFGDDITELSELAQMSDDALDTEDDSVDPSFDLNNSMKLDNDHMNWVMHLDRDDRVSLGLFL